MGLPGNSVSKESSCSVGDLGSIPGLGRSPGEAIGYPLQDSWPSSLMAQTVKNPPATRETEFSAWVRKIPLEERVATHFSVLAWRIPTDRGTWWAAVRRLQKVQLSTAQQLYLQSQQTEEIVDECLKEVSGLGLDATSIFRTKRGK